MLGNMLHGALRIVCSNRHIQEGRVGSCRHQRQNSRTLLYTRTKADERGLQIILLSPAKQLIPEA